MLQFPLIVLFFKASTETRGKLLLAKWNQVTKKEDSQKYSNFKSVLKDSFSWAS